jgi:Ca2+-binding RTX toxin-like protein
LVIKYLTVDFNGNQTMSDSSSIDNPNAPQLAAANPATNVEGARDADVAPASPGLGLVVAQAAGTGVVPDLTLLDLEVLLNLDLTANARSIGQSLEIQPLQSASDDADLPADLTSVDLSQLLELGLAGEQLPSLAEIADLPPPKQGTEVAETFQGEAEVSLPEQAQAADNAETGGATDNANPVADLLLDGKGKADDELKSEADFDVDSISAYNTSPVDAPSGNPSTENPGNGNGGGSGSQIAQASDGANNGQGNGPGSNNGQGNGSNTEVAANNNAGGNSGSNAGEIVLASISFSDGGDLPASIAPDDVPPASDPNPAESTSAPTSAAPLAPPSSAASTFVSSSDAADGPGNSDFGASNGNGAGNGSPSENLPVADSAPASGGSNAPLDAPQGVSMSGGGGIDMIIGTAGDDNLLGNGGNDTIDGLAGDDTIDGGGGKDSLIGGDDADELIGKGGSDTLDGGAGDDTLNGGGGSDFLDGGAGFDELIGGGGADILVWDFADLNIDGGGNTDTLRVDGGDADITAFGGTISGIDHVDLESDAGANTLTVSYADVLAMTDNSDTLVIDGDGLDSVDAGTGWTDGGVSGGYHTYTQGSGPNTATLLVDTDITNVLV